jgi:hypothetical protein
MEMETIVSEIITNQPFRKKKICTGYLARPRKVYDQSGALFGVAQSTKHCVSIKVEGI